MRDQITIRTMLLRWLDKTQSQMDLARRVEYVDDIRRLRFAFRTWQQAIEEKRKREVREGIRRRYSLIKHVVDVRIQRQAFRVSICIPCLNTCQRIHIHI